MFQDITERNEHVDREHFDYGEKCIDVYMRGSMSREEIEKANESDYIQFIQIKNGFGSYVLHVDIEDYTLNHAGEEMMIQTQSLDDINWEED